MANLTEKSEFPEGIFQIETDTIWLGGEDGPANNQGKQLANRTRFLKGKTEALESAKANIASPTFTGTPKAPTAAAGTNTTQIATTAFVITRTPDASAATATADGAAGMAIYAADSDKASRNKAATPANVAAQITARAASAATDTADGNAAGLVKLAATNNKTALNMAATPANVAAQIAAIDIPPATPAATAATATADGKAGAAIYAKDSDTTSRNKAATPAGVAAQVAESMTPRAIDADTDLDTIKEPGFYFCGMSITAATVLNCPTSKAFSLLVEKHAGAKQTVTEHMGNNTSRMWFRNFYQGWSDWRLIIDATTLQMQAATYFSTDAGTAPSYTLTTNAGYKVSTPVIGSRLCVRFADGVVAGMAAPTLNINGSGAYPVVVRGNVGLAPAMIVAGARMDVTFDGSNWLVIGGALNFEAVNISVRRATTGTAPAYDVTTYPYYGALANGQRLRLTFHAATAAGATPTLNRDGLGAKNIRQYNALGAKVPAVIPAYWRGEVEYDGTDYVILDALPSGIQTFALSAVPTTKTAGEAIHVIGHGTWEWVKTAHFEGYRHPECGNRVDGDIHATPPAYLVDAVGGNMSKTTALGSRLFAAFQEAGLVVAKTSWTAGWHHVCDNGDGNFRLPDLRGTFARAAAGMIDPDTANAVALGAYKADTLKSHSHPAYNGYGAIANAPGFQGGQSYQLITPSGNTGTAETAPRHTAYHARIHV